MKKVLVGVLGLLFSLFPVALLADDILAPPAGDLSISYLSIIFGVVDGLLHGQNQVLGTMLGSFNSVILILMSTVLSYTLFVSILNTAHQGEFLGQKWSSVWIPLRMIGSVALLAPKASGYCLIQILVVGIIIMGVGAADHSWQALLGYMNRNGTIVGPNQALGPGQGGQGTPDNTFLIPYFGSVLKSLICMDTLHNGWLIKYRHNSGIFVPDVASSLMVTGKGPDGMDTGKPIDYTKDKGGFINFPGQLDGTFARYKSICGSVNWDFIHGKPDNGQVANPANLTANDSASLGVRQVTLDLSAFAQNIANTLAPPYAETPPSVHLDKGSSLLLPNALVYASGDYFAIVKPAEREVNEEEAKKYKDFIPEAEKTGWIMAGAEWWKIMQLNTFLQKGAVSVDKNQIHPSFSPNYDSDAFQDIDSTVLDNLKRNLPATSGVIDSFIQDEISRSNDPNSHNQLFPNTGGGGDIGQVGGFMGKVFGAIFESESDMIKQINATLKAGGNPIEKVMQIGDSMIRIAEAAWVLVIGLIYILTGAGAALGVAASFIVPAGPIVAIIGAAIGIVGVFAPIFILWLTINLALGAIMAYYVPLIIPLVFTGASITWLLAAVTATIAAPLVPLALANPEGHDVWGKSEPAIMLIVNVFFYPMLMIFGFATAIILTWVSISLLNQVLSLALDFTQKLSGDFLGIVSITTFLSMYVYTLVWMITRAASAIFEIPKQTMRWLGHHAESGQEEGMLQQVRGGAEQNVRELGHTGSQMVQSGQQFGSQTIGATKRHMAESESRSSKGTSIGPDQDDDTPPQ